MEHFKEIIDLAGEIPMGIPRTTRIINQASVEGALRNERMPENLLSYRYLAWG